MKAVWTYWSRPAESGRSTPWRTQLHHFLAWGLSLHAARKHYPETVLVTDRNGKKLLIEKLGLPFAHVSTELDRLRDVDPGWWALGKLVSYSMQPQPFIHIDTDAFLWKRLPPEVEAAPVIAQCPEIRTNKHDCYQGEIERAFIAHHAKLPTEWEWERSLDTPQFREENCGIVGGQNVAFLRYFAETALDLVLSPANASAWRSLGVKFCYNMVIEQYLLSALIGFHRYHPESPFKGIKAKYLFTSWEEGLDQNRTARLGFTHLMGGAKSHPAVARRLEDRLRRDDPGYFRLCDRLARATA
jgi:hypothetical protein